MMTTETIKKLAARMSDDEIQAAMAFCPGGQMFWNEVTRVKQEMRA